MAINKEICLKSFDSANWQRLCVESVDAGIDVDIGKAIISKRMGSLPSITGQNDTQIDKAELARALLRTPYFKITHQIKKTAEQVFGIKVPFWPNKESKSELTPSIARLRIEQTTKNDEQVLERILHTTRFGFDNGIGLFLKTVEPYIGPEKNIDEVIKAGKARCTEILYPLFIISIASLLDVYPIEVFPEGSTKIHASMAAKINDKILYIDPFSNDDPITNFPPWIIHFIGDAPLLLGGYAYNNVFDGMIKGKEAVDIMQTMVDINPGSPTMLFGLAKAQKNMNMNFEAWQNLCASATIWDLVPGIKDLKEAIENQEKEKTLPICPAFSNLNSSTTLPE